MWLTFEIVMDCTGYLLVHYLTKSPSEQQLCRSIKFFRIKGLRDLPHVDVVNIMIKKKFLIVYICFFTSSQVVKIRKKLKENSFYKNVGY